MTNQTKINQGELAELLKDDVGYVEAFFDDDTGSMMIEIEWSDNRQVVILEHQQEQTYKIIHTTSHDMYEGDTISVDEILDIVL